MLFFINVGTMLLGLILFAVFALAFQNLELLLYSVNIVCLINSLISETIVCKTIKIKLGFDIVAEIIVAIIFLICSRFLPDWISFCAFLVVVLLFFIFNRATIKEMLTFVKKKWTKAKES